MYTKDKRWNQLQLQWIKYARTFISTTLLHTHSYQREKQKSQSRLLQVCMMQTEQQFESEATSHFLTFVLMRYSLLMDTLKRMLLM